MPALKRRGRRVPHYGRVDTRRGPHSVAVAVRGMAEVGAAPDHPGGARRWPGGIASRPVAVGARVEPVCTPLPHVAGDVEQPESVRLVGIHRSRAEESVIHRVASRENTLPDVAPMIPAGCQLVPRRIALAPVPRAPRTPSRFGGQPHARPGAVRLGVGEGHVDDGVVVPAVERSAALRMPPSASPRRPGAATGPAPCPASVGSRPAAARRRRRTVRTVRPRSCGRSRRRRRPRACPANKVRRVRLTVSRG